MNGEKIDVPENEIIFRPAAYGVIVHERKILLSKFAPTGKYTLPGGALEIGETHVEALKRETLEECGIEIEVGRCVERSGWGMLFVTNLLVQVSVPVFYTIIQTGSCSPKRAMGVLAAIAAVLLLR